MHFRYAAAWWNISIFGKHSFTYMSSYLARFFLQTEKKQVWFVGKGKMIKLKKTHAFCHSFHCARAMASKRVCILLVHHLKNRIIHWTLIFVEWTMDISFNKKITSSFELGVKLRMHEIILKMMKNSNQCSHLCFLLFVYQVSLRKISILSLRSSRYWFVKETSIRKCLKKHIYRKSMRHEANIVTCHMRSTLSWWAFAICSMLCRAGQI